MVIAGQRRQKSMTNRLFEIGARDFGVETPASRYSSLNMYYYSKYSMYFNNNKYIYSLL